MQYAKRFHIHYFSHCFFKSLLFVELCNKSHDIFFSRNRTILNEYGFDTTHHRAALSEIRLWFDRTGVFRVRML